MTRPSTSAGMSSHRCHARTGRSAAPWRSAERGPGRSLGAVCAAVLAALVLAIWTLPALALKAIEIDADVDRIDVTEHAEYLDGRGDSIQVETAPGADGMVGRMNVRASAQGLNPNWIVFALRNKTDRPIERWVTAERYTMSGSGIVWPDLDARRIEAVTPSLGFLPERVKSDRADIFRVTLEPGQTVTYVAELASDRFARVYVWRPIDYELKARDRQLFNGILLGIAGVLGVFLTVVFAANHKPIFPSAALVTWCVLAYLCVDFGFWHKLFQLRPEDNAVYRAATEAAMAASLLVFLYIFLRLTASHGITRMLLGVWMIAQIALIAVAVIDARLASTFARASFAAIGGFGILTITYLALRGQDRALSLLPTWVLFLVWIFAASVTLTGRLSTDLVVSSLAGGLVLITVLVGFTVTQFAFRSLEPLYGGTSPSEQQVRSLAIDGSGSALWEWNARREEIKTGPLIEATLGLNAGELSTRLDDFCNHLHPADRERFRLLLWSVQERGGGDIRLEFRMLHADNSYRWFHLEAASVPASDRRSLRCVGLMREVTDAKRAQERLLHDAVHDSLTGLPNRELFLDRLGVAFVRAKSEPLIAPTVMLIDMDKFKSVNASFGLHVGDSLLLVLARRLQKHLQPQDTLARVGGNQFALLMLQTQDTTELAQLAESIRRSLRSPIKLAGQEIVLTGAVGIAIYDNKIASAEDLLKEAEVAMYRAKRGGADRVEIFRPELRSEVDDRVAIESDLRRALERKQLFVLYQPIISLATEELAGFEALVRWQHPKLGTLSPGDFVPVAEESDLIVKLGSYVLTQAVEDAAEWQRLLPRAERPVFVSVNVSSRQLFRQDLLQEIRHTIGRALVPPGALRLEITESLVMENPEKACEVLEWLRAAGAGLSLDDFGTGYSSLSYVHRFPFDTIKIDRDLVQASGADGTGTGSAIVRSIVALAHELGKKVVAEGVELQSDVGFLRSIGCEYAQGYYYREPIPAREVEKMLRAIHKTESRMQRSGLFRAKSKRRPERKSQQRRPTAAAGMSGEAEAAMAGAGHPPGEMGAGAERPHQRPGSGMRMRPRGAQRGRAPEHAGNGATPAGAQPPRSPPMHTAPPQSPPPMPPPMPPSAPFATQHPAPPAAPYAAAPDAMAAAAGLAAALGTAGLAVGTPPAPNPHHPGEASPFSPASPYATAPPSAPHAANGAYPGGPHPAYPPHAAPPGAYDAPPANGYGAHGGLPDAAPASMPGLPPLPHGALPHDPGPPVLRPLSDLVADAAATGSAPAASHVPHPDAHAPPPAGSPTDLASALSSMASAVDSLQPTGAPSALPGGGYPQPAPPPEAQPSGREPYVNGHQGPHPAAQQPGSQPTRPPQPRPARPATPPPATMSDLSTLPPAIAASLAKLAKTQPAAAPASATRPAKAEVEPGE